MLHEFAMALAEEKTASLVEVNLGEYPDAWNGIVNSLKIENTDDLLDLMKGGIAVGSTVGGLAGFAGALKARNQVKDMQKRLEQFGDSAIKDKLKMLRLLEQHESDRAPMGSRFINFMKGLYSGTGRQEAAQPAKKKP